MLDHKYILNLRPGILWALLALLSSPALASYSVPTHQKGTCNGGSCKAAIRSVVIYTQHLSAVYLLRNEDLPECKELSKNGFYAIDSRQRPHLSLSADYRMQILVENEDGNLHLASCAAWIDYNGDSTFSANEMISRDGYTLSPKYEDILKFTTPGGNKSIQARLRIRTDYATNRIDSIDHSSELEYGQTIDIDVVLVPQTPDKTDFWAPDTVEAGEYFECISAHREGIANTWSRSFGGVEMGPDLQIQIPDTGTFSVQLRTRFSNGKRDTVNRKITVVSRQKARIPVFLRGRAQIPLYDALHVAVVGYNAKDTLTISLGNDSKTTRYLSGDPSFVIFTARDIPGFPDEGAWDICIGVHNQSTLLTCKPDYLLVQWDSVAPDQILVGDDTLCTEVDSLYRSPGAHAFDNYHGDLTEMIQFYSDFDSSEIGEYVEKYWVRDSSGNLSDTLYRVVLVLDKTPPVITLLGDDTICMEKNTTYVSRGATAQDNVDGDISMDIKVFSNVNSKVEGQYYEKYVVRDSSGNESDTVIRIVIVVRDKTPPVIQLNGADSVVLFLDSSYSELGATAFDSIDGDLTDSIEITHNIDSSQVGYYVVRYYVEDSAGLSDTAFRVVRVISKVSIEKWSADPYSLKIWPNPSAGILDVHSSIELNKIHLLDLQGKHVRSFKCQDLFRSTLDLSDLPRGLYMLQFEGNGMGTQFRKIVIK